jgi:hypothetical protein
MLESFAGVTAGESTLDEGKTTISLSVEERATLLRVLENYLSDLRVEIVNTDFFEFKQMLRERQSTLTHVQEKLREA